MTSSLAPATFNTTNTIGVDVASNFPHYQTPSSAASQTQLYYPETQNPDFAPGMIVMTGSGGKAILAQVTSVGSINQYDFVAFLASIPSTFTVQQLTSTLAATGPRVGVNAFGGSAGFAATTSTQVQWCWIALEGSGIKGNLVSTTSANLPLWISTVPGQLWSASTGTYLVTGVTNAISTTSQAGVPIVAGPMMISQPGSTASTGLVGPF